MRDGPLVAPGGLLARLFLAAVRARLPLVSCLALAAHPSGPLTLRCAALRCCCCCFFTTTIHHRAPLAIARSPPLPPSTHPPAAAPATDRPRPVRSRSHPPSTSRCRLARPSLTTATSDLTSRVSLHAGCIAPSSSPASASPLCPLLQARPLLQALNRDPVSCFM
ncbi:hypothetical protein EJ04DRAFT_24693 [Polyplosphaeria fusca]|uniref:Uncharacterized protein n=1 Tax=Polyplosphaeria fusca TaxID=682080 RepID=A0A9P4V3Q1_9PLEO|nr:hypothetical protein EJ04DRAFT_24693 [Polyplosphaeria fusca]